MMNLKKTASLFVVLGLFGSVIVTPLSASIYNYSGDIEYSAGTGSNQATIVIDFDASNSFLFTYNWDGSATGWNALDALNSAGSLIVYATDWGSWGMFVDDFDYSTGAEYDYGDGANTSWAYYLSSDNQNWALDSGGVSFRTLSDGDYDSWVWTNYSSDWSVAYRTPGATPIPEPCTIVLVGIGGLALRKRH